MQSIGERLEEARKRKGLSIREASEATKIRSDYLHKFESNQFDINLPEIYVKGFLRTYANFLKAPSEKLIADYMGLGLGEGRPRQINREVYGRMDLSVGSKMEKDGKEKPAPAGIAEPVATNEDAAPRNPATFVPPHTPPAGFQIRRDMVIIGGALVLGLAVVIMLGIWLFRGSGEKTTTKPSSSTAAVSTDSTWVRPQPGEPALVLVPTGTATVTVTSKRDNATIFQGTISRGDRRELPRRGTLQIVTEQPQNLMLEIDGNQWPMKDPKTNQFINSANIPGR